MILSRGLFAMLYKVVLTKDDVCGQNRVTFQMKATLIMLIVPYNVTMVLIFNILK